MNQLTPNAYRAYVQSLLAFSPFRIGNHTQPHLPLRLGCRYELYRLLVHDVMTRRLVDAENTIVNLESSTSGTVQSAHAMQMGGVRKYSAQNWCTQEEAKEERKKEDGQKEDKWRNRDVTKVRCQV